jgi:hypothetical protein
MNASKEQNVRTWKPELQAIMAILRSWDPIGVLPGPGDDDGPMDEYDDYAYGIHTILRGGANSEALADHLETIRTETMGCPPDRQRDELIAAELLKRWRHLKGEAV